MHLTHHRTQIENSGPGENHIKALSCTIAVPLHLRQPWKAASGTCPIPKKKAKFAGQLGRCDIQPC